MEADMQCTNAVHSMERKLRTACHSADAKLDHVLKVIVSAILATSIFFFLCFCGLLVILLTKSSLRVYSLCLLI